MELFVHFYSIDKKTANDAMVVDGGINYLEIEKSELTNILCLKNNVTSKDLFSTELGMDTAEYFYPLSKEQVTKIINLISKDEDDNNYYDGIYRNDTISFLPKFRKAVNAFNFDTRTLIFSFTEGK